MYQVNSIFYVEEIRFEPRFATCTLDHPEALNDQGRRVKLELKKREIDKIGYTRVVSEQNRVPFVSRRKIFHTTGKLPTVTTVMQAQQHC